MSQKGFAPIFIILGLVIIIILIGGLYIWKYNSSIYQSNSKPSVIHKSASSSANNGIPDKDIFLTSVPNPPKNVGEIPNIDLNATINLPDNMFGTNIMAYKNHIWLNSDGRLLEYDPDTKSLIRFTDRNKILCADVAIIDDNLYSLCRTTGSRSENEKIYKINLINNKLDQIIPLEFSINKKLNGNNLWADDKGLWLVASYGDKGLAYFDASTKSFTNFTDELAKIIPNWNGNGRFLVDKDYVWLALKVPYGKTALLMQYNKTTKSWLSYTPYIIGSRNITYFDLPDSDPLLLIPGGIEILFYDQDVNKDTVCIVSDYSYTTDKWTEVARYKDGCDPLNPQLEQRAKRFLPVKVASNRFGEDLVTFVQNNQSYSFTIQPKINLVLNQPINGISYILTHHTIDELSPYDKYPQTLISLDEGILSRLGHLDQNDVLSRLLIDPTSLIAVVIHSTSGDSEHSSKTTIWVYDLYTKKLLKKYNQTELIGFPFPELSEFNNSLADKITKMIKQQNKLLLQDDMGTTYYTINLDNYQIESVSK